MNHHQGLAALLMEMIMVVEIKVFGKANIQVLCMRSMSRLFYKLSLKLFYFPNPNMLTVKIMRPSSLSRASACSHCYFCSHLLHCACVYIKQHLAASLLNEFHMSHTSSQSVVVFADKCRDLSTERLHGL